METKQNTLYINLELQPENRRIFVTIGSQKENKTILSFSFPTAPLEDNDDKLWYLSLALYHLINHVAFPAKLQDKIHLRVNSWKLRKTMNRILNKPNTLRGTTEKKLHNILLILQQQVQTIKIVRWISVRFRTMRTS